MSTKVGAVHIGNFNGTFRNECLDTNWFESLGQGRQGMTIWGTDYNETRPHSSCGRVPPAPLANLSHQLTSGKLQHSKTGPATG